MSGRAWAPADEEKLEGWYGTVRVAEIAQRLGRTVGAVRNHATIMKLGPCKPPDSLSMNEVMQALGLAAHGSVVTWIREGYLPAVRGSRFGGSKTEWVIKNADFERFLAQYPHLVERNKVERAYRQFVPERWITLPEVFKRGGAYIQLTESACKAGLIPEARHRGPLGTWWVVPESILPRLVAARRTQTSDARHRTLVVAYNQHEASGGLRRRNKYHMNRMARESASGGHSGARVRLEAVG